MFLHKLCKLNCCSYLANNNNLAKIVLILQDAWKSEGGNGKRACAENMCLCICGTGGSRLSGYLCGTQLAGADGGLRGGQLSGELGDQQRQPRQRRGGAGHPRVDPHAHAYAHVRGARNDTLQTNPCTAPSNHVPSSSSSSQFCLVLLPACSAGTFSNYGK